MYSHELQTCDWPRNVGCDASTQQAQSTPSRTTVTPRVPQVLSRIRFSSSPASAPSAPSAPSGPSGPSAPSGPSGPGPSAPARIQPIHSLPPPPPPANPNPVITTRGQPKNSPQEDIAKLYAEAHDTLPPVEEEESDRQQRVYRGQPSTVTQVQRDRDGILQQPSVNAIPTQTKVGSFAYSAQPQPFSDEDQLQDLDREERPSDSKTHDRKKRDVAVDSARTSTGTEDVQDKQNLPINTTISHQDDFAESTKLTDPTLLEAEVNSEESARSARQLRPLGNWQYRSLDTSLSRHNSFPPSSFDPYAYSAGPTSATYLKSRARYYQPQIYNKKVITNNYNDYLEAYVKSKQHGGSQYLRPVEVTNYKPVEPQNYKPVTKINPQDSLIPLLISNQSPRPQQYQTAFTAAAFVNNQNGKKYSTPVPDTDDGTIPDNFAYFHFGNHYSSTPISVNNHAKNGVKSNPVPQQSHKVSQSTNRSPFIAFSSVGGFFNNQPTANPLKESFIGVSKHANNNQPIQKATPKILAGPSTPAPVYENANSLTPLHRFPVTTPKTTVSSLEYYPQNLFLSHSNLFNGGNSPAIVSYGGYNDKPVPVYESSTLRPAGYFVTKSTNGFQPITVSTTPRYYHAGSQNTPDYTQFFESVKNTHIKQGDSKLVDGLQNIGAQYPKNSTTNLRPISSGQQYNKIVAYGPSTVKPIHESNEYYYEQEDNGHKYVKNTLNSNRKPTYPKRPSEEDEEEYYEDDDEDDYEYRFPINKSKYTPMTETMAPRPLANLTTPKPGSYVSGHVFYKNHKYETTTWRPNTITTHASTTSDIPPIITFPEDVFQGIKPFGDIPRYQNKSTVRPYIVRTRVRPTAIPNANLIDETTSKELQRTTAKSHSSKHTVKTTPSTTTTTKTTTTTTTTTTVPPPIRTRPTTTASTYETTARKRYTVRPNRGQQRWRTTTETPEQPTVSTRPNKNQLRNDRLELDERLPNRVETSSPAPSRYNNDQQQKTVLSQSSKNYYNTSNYDPSAYDNYFAVYDEDVELYRDVEYQPQYNQNNQQSSQPPQRPTVSSTYRPTVVTTVAPTSQRDQSLYVTSPRTTYQQRPSYQADYDDALVSQLEDDRYNQKQTHTQLRNDLNSITDRPILVSSTIRTFNSPKYQTAYVTSPEPFSLPSTTTTRTTTTTTTITTTPAPLQYYTTRSSQLDEKSKKSTPKTIILTLAARAGSSTTTTESPLLVSFSPFSYTTGRSGSTASTASSNIFRLTKNSTSTSSTTTSTTTSTEPNPSSFLSSSSETYDNQPNRIPPEIKFHPIPDDSYYDDDEYPLSKTRYEYDSQDNDSSNDQSSKKYITQKLLPINSPSSNYGSSGPRENSPFSYDQPKKYFPSNYNKFHSSSTSTTTTTTKRPTTATPTTTSTSTTTSTTTTTTITPRTTSIPITQRQKIQNYIVSEVQPESFKPFNSVTSSKIASPSENDNNLNSGVRTRGQNTFLKALGTTLSATQQSTIATSTNATPASAYSSVAHTRVKPTEHQPDSEDIIRLTLNSKFGNSQTVSGSPQPTRHFVRPEQLEANDTIRLTLNAAIASSSTTPRAPYSPSSPRYTVFDESSRSTTAQSKFVHSSTTTTTTDRSVSHPTRYEIKPEQFQNNKSIRLTLSAGVGGKPTLAKGSVETIDITSSAPRYIQFTQSDAVFTTTSEPSTTTPKVLRLSPSSTSFPTRSRYYQDRGESSPSVRPTSRPTKVSFQDTDPTASSEWSPSYQNKILSSPQTNTLQESEEQEPDDLLIPSKAEQNYHNQLEVKTPPPTRFPPRTSPPPTAAEDSRKIAEAVQSFTSRGQVFKETLNKTLEPSNNPRVVVSPFKSLEVQRQTTSSDKPFAYSTSRVIANIYRTTTEAPQRESPFRSYFLITAPPKLTNTGKLSSLPISSTTEATTTASTTTTTEPTTTTTSTTPSTTTTTTSTTSTTTSTTPLTTSMAFTSSSYSSSTEDTTSTTVPKTTEVYRGRYRPVFNLVKSPEASDELTTPRYRIRNRIPTRRTYTRLRPTALTASSRSHITGKDINNKPFTNTESTLLSVSTEYSDRRVSSTTSSYLNRISSTERSRYGSEDSSVKSSHYKSRFSDDSAEVFKKVTVPSENVTSRANNEPAKVVEITDKPVYYTSYHLTSTEVNSSGPPLNSKTETTTKKFRATVEMPEMNIPTEKDLLSYQQDDSASNEEEEDEDVPDEEDEDLPEEYDSYLESTSAAPTPTPTTSTTTTPSSRPAGPYKPLYRASKRFTTTTTEQTPPQTSPQFIQDTSTHRQNQTSTLTLPVTSTTRSNLAWTSSSSTIDSAAYSDESEESYSPSSSANTTTTVTTTTITTTTTATNTTPRLPTTYSINKLPPRASRVNNAIKTTIAAAQLPRRYSKPSAGKSIQCTENSFSAKCNEIPSRRSSASNSNRNRGQQQPQYVTDIQSTVSANRGTHPPRARPTLKPAQTIVSKAQEFIDIYRHPATRPEPLYPQPTPDKTAAKCRKDVCQLPDCYCGGKDVPGDLPVEQVPQIVLLTFDDSVNDLNKQLYQDLFERGRVNPNGCPITATFYVSHEWTDYSQVQNLYADGHEMASHTVSHSFGEAFSPKKWAREVAGQREILSAYGGVKLEDVRGMRAPFLSIGGNKMFKMLYDFNFTYDSSMPVYENRPPSWPYTLDYKIFHDCMIPPCPTKSYPGVWEVPMVMWQDLNGGRCSMGDACSNPPDVDGVYKMIMKNFERHYTTNRAPFGLYYHAAWFTQPHHKEGFIQFLDTINSMKDVFIVTNWQALQWVRDPTPMSRMNSFQPFQCNYSDRPKRCNNPKVCNLWHKSGVRYMRTCQPCPEIYPWTGKTGIRSSRIDNDIEVADTN
ncbi:mucin-5AC-like [Sabethes cyaneus]|uniref:mucin-5AC-like n=1 Tax=Sabethes cyaneus TaxID=53552 RepID=UPI00237E297D|nr:mucin-5AC-like [Sabethes cyaneus]